MPVIIQVRGMSIPNGLLPCLELQKHKSPSGDTRPSVAALVSGGVTLVPMKDDVYFDDRSFDPAVSGESDIRLLSMTQSGRISETEAFVLLQLDYSKLGGAVRKSLIDGVVPTMEVRALAAPAFWEGVVLPERPLQLSDFSVTSPWVRIEVDRVADVVELAHSKYGGHLSAPLTMRANAPSSGYELVKPPYSLYPGDRLSFGQKDAAKIRWAAGETFDFTANPSALTPKEDRLICVISATQADDILDRANYPGDRWGHKANQLLGLIRSKHPAVSLVFKAGKGTLWSVVFKKRILAEGASMTVDHRIITGIVDEVVDLVVPKSPVEIIQLESTAVFQLKSQPEFYLLEGKLTLLDSELKPRTQITSGQALKFDERNQPLPPQSFQRSDLPAEAQEALRIVESMVEAKPIDWLDPSTLGLYVGYVLAGLFGLFVLKKCVSWLFGGGKRRVSAATSAPRNSPIPNDRNPEATLPAKRTSGFSPIGLLILLGFAGGLAYGAYFTLEDVTRNWKAWPKGEELGYVGMMSLVSLFFLGWAVKHVYSSARQWLYGNSIR